MRVRKEYSGIHGLPVGRASDAITEGCLVLEGGAWKCLYTIGVVDAMMIHGINLRTTVGISGGALTGLGYVSGQIGWAAGVDLRYRHDRNYCGIGAYKKDHGITGFSYLFKELNKIYPLDKESLYKTPRELVVGATNMLTGEVEYFKKSERKILRPAQASATVPYISRPIVLSGVPYLDGGCVEKIPYEWAKKQGEKKIIVVKTRELSYRRKEGNMRIAKLMYKDYPELVKGMSRANTRFNDVTEELIKDSDAGRIFLIAPSKAVDVSRFEGDMEKLGELYWLGYHDLEDRLQELKDYLGSESDEIQE